MTTRTTLLAGASRFAHFAGLSGRASRRAEEDDRRDEEREGKRGSRAEDDDEDGDREPKGKRGSRAEDDDQDGDREPKGKRGSRAEDDDEDGDREPKGKRGSRAEDDDEDGDREPKGKRGARADDDDAEDDDDEREMNGRSAAAQARMRENSRCAAIFAHPHAAADMSLACLLAFDTRMTRSRALRRMDTAAAEEPRRPRAAGRDADRRREARNPDLDAGAPAVGGGQAVAASWGRAMDKVHGAAPKR